MKTFFISILVILIFSTGIGCISLFVAVKGFGWYHIIFLIGTFLITIPALSWWREFLYKLFDVDLDD